ncbi:MAG: DegV family protein [Candidatus Paceibacterota bacterium]
MEEINNKKSIGLVADEMGDLPEELIKENNVSIVPFKIEYGELSEFPGNVYQKIREGEKQGLKALIKTSQPSVSGFLNAFQEKLKQFENIVCVTFSSKISGAYNSALQAVKFLPDNLRSKVFIIDSFAGSGSEGLVILRVAELIKDTRLKIEDVVSQIKKELSNFKLVGAYEKPKWIEASGRLPSFLPIALNQAEIRNIKPIFGLRGGKLSIVSIKKNLKGLANTLFEEFSKQTAAIRQEDKKIKIAITHADNPEQAEKLESLIKNQADLELVYIGSVCYPIGAHIGPGSLIFSWQQ